MVAFLFWEIFELCRDGALARSVEQSSTRIASLTTE